MLSRLLFSCCLIFCATFLHAQNTLGTILNDEASMDGYTFFSPFSGTKAWMVDNCGQLINVWDRDNPPGLSAHFLDNGLMLRTYKVNTAGPFTSASNAGGLELVDWENNTVWSYEINTSEQLSHHDAVYMPNGNILVLTWMLVYEDEIIELGRDPDEIAVEGFMWSENILELEPVGNNDANIVWEWNIKHHYIQDFDPTKQNYGVISEHPELFNINLPELNSSNSNATRDWNHFNAIDYNPALDQILISVRNSDEFWILDHSTTTSEAASHEGGLYGKGGDILYRWGNAGAYERGPVSDQKLFGQHGVNWIKDGLDDAGKIMLFNNGNGRPGTDFSSGEIIDPPQNMDGSYPVPAIEPFGPAESTVLYGNSSDEYLYSPYLSNAQRLPNGNTLLNYGSIGTIREITPDREVVWEYIIPLNGDNIYSQGQNPNNNSSFRAYKFPASFAGFDGLDLTPGLTIQLGIDQIDCEITTSTENINNSIEAELKFNMNNQVLELNNPNNEVLEVWLVQLNGTRQKLKSFSSIESTWTLGTQSAGICFVQLRSKDGQSKTEKILLIR